VRCSGLVGAGVREWWPRRAVSWAWRRARAARFVRAVVIGNDGPHAAWELPRLIEGPLKLARIKSGMC
jgi:hypothetical protein